jgi:hypothetical protein
MGRFISASGNHYYPTNNYGYYSYSYYNNPTVTVPGGSTYSTPIFLFSQRSFVEKNIEDNIPRVLIVGPGFNSEYWWPETTKIKGWESNDGEDDWDPSALDNTI